MYDRFVVRIAGRLGPALRAAFSGSRFEVVPPRTLIRGRLSRDELERLLERMDRSGVTLVHLECCSPSGTAGTAGGDPDAAAKAADANSSSVADGALPKRPGHG